MESFVSEFTEIQKEAKESGEDTLFSRLRKSSPVPVTVDPKDPMFGSIRGGYYDRDPNRIGMAEENPNTLAHEIGHAEFDKSMLGRITQSRAAHLGHMLGPIAASATGFIPTKTPTQKALALGLPLLATMPTMVSEGVASVKGHGKMKEHGATEEELSAYRRQLAKAYLTYAAYPASGLAGHLAYGAIRKKVTGS